MLVAAVHGVARVDSTLQLAAAAPPGQSRFVVDVRGRREPAHPLGAWRDCEHGHGDGRHTRASDPPRARRRYSVRGTGTRRGAACRARWS